MADIDPQEDAPQDDVEMDTNDAGDPDIDDDAAENATGAEALPSSEVVDQPPVVSFLDFLKSPIVYIAVGAAPAETTLAAHQDFLTKSPWFAQACTALPADRTIRLPDEDLDAVGCVLEYLYNAEYFPRALLGGGLEKDPRFPIPDGDGSSLLRHGRVYTLADKLELPKLKSLAHSKIQATTSTARGEIVFARYVYANTLPEDRMIRNPVAQFWATRSHVLRHEAEQEFRDMCIEFPQFGFDVLTRVLDHKEKSSGGGGGAGVNLGGTPLSGRKAKRPRVSLGA